MKNEKYTVKMDLFYYFFNKKQVTCKKKFSFIFFFDNCYDIFHSHCDKNNK